MAPKQHIEQPAPAPTSSNEAESKSLVNSDAAEDNAQPKIHKKPSVWKLVTKLFAWELLAVFLSTALLAAIIGILASYNHQPQPIWDYTSLNSVISWLSTISKGCVLFAISESLGQLKWLWFTQKSRPMSHLRTFDAASRGVTGSAELIWNLRAKHFAATGSLAVILALAFDPFTQNLIQYYSKLTPDASQTATVSNSTGYDVIGSQYALGGESYVDPTLKANVYNSLFNSDTTKPWSIPNYTCSTGNCTWDPISSLGMQAICSNVTNYLNFDCYTITNSSWAGDQNCTITIQYNSTTSDISTYYVENSPMAIPIAIGRAQLSIIQDDTAFSHMHIIAPAQSVENISKYTNTTQWQAMECVLQPIVRRVRPYVTQGVYHEETLSVWTDGSIDKNSSAYVLRPTWGPEMGIAHNTTFKLSSTAALAMDEFFHGFFAGTVQTSLQSISFIRTEYFEYASADFMQAITVSNITGCTATGAERFRCAMENGAAAISKTFRDSASSSSGTDGNATTAGQAMSNVTYVVVHWQWIALPALVWLLGIVTLVGTMMKSRRAVVPMWKNDVMPLLFVYEGGQNVQPPADGELENNQRVKLYNSEGRIMLGE
ncbi:uncharacterized protein N7496_008295 [Penicillium cataractarum]|uniref:Uncharacterized protein n=1 Tax=Penicillium cataractarum TaxID=2100454 RepID=A0A9W9RZF2_9EURO|nr:uncharacterized protein N7496_008295 [Penicillium cataractarum]KAJ5368535.1 hypothetical protein N7496_008295 [Penicillium cataractarum]